MQGEDLEKNEGKLVAGRTETTETLYIIVPSVTLIVMILMVIFHTGL